VRTDEVPIRTVEEEISIFIPTVSIRDLKRGRDRLSARGDIDTGRDRDRGDYGGFEILSVTQDTEDESNEEMERAFHTRRRRGKKDLNSLSY